MGEDRCEWMMTRKTKKEDGHTSYLYESKCGAIVEITPPFHGFIELEVLVYDRIPCPICGKPVFVYGTL